jgi:hydroxymethylpyrimidine pyrophosphatase-like HAD family hydrolase
MRRVVFIDLDDTLFHTAHRVSPVGAETVAWASDGSPASFMHPHQRAFYDWIAAGADVVPTTGRNADAYRRVSLGFEGWAICSFGGLILRPDGSSEPRWRERIAPLAEAQAGRLDALSGLATGDAVRTRVVMDDGLPLYLSIKTAVGSESALTPVLAALRDAVAPGWQIHLNGHNLAVMPPFLGKEHAVRWYRAHIAGADALAIGVGDSLSDAAFLAACDYAVTPSRSQLLARLTDPP